MPITLHSHNSHEICGMGAQSFETKRALEPVRRNDRLLTVALDGSWHLASRASNQLWKKQQLIISSSFAGRILAACYEDDTVDA